MRFGVCTWRLLKMHGNCAHECGIVDLTLSSPVHNRRITPPLTNVIMHWYWAYKSVISDLLLSTPVRHHRLSARLNVIVSYRAHQRASNFAYAAEGKSTLAAGNTEHCAACSRMAFRSSVWAWWLQFPLIEKSERKGTLGRSSVRDRRNL